MPIRTGVSEDPKGDPSKVIPNQPEPALPGDPTEEVTPLLPPPDRSAGPPPRPGKTAQTPADRRGTDDVRKKP